MGEPYAGNSGTHMPRGNAIETTNGAGSHNIQMFLMNPDGDSVEEHQGFIRQLVESIIKDNTRPDAISRIRARSQQEV